jgi:hypothetical protein
VAELTASVGRLRRRLLAVPAIAAVEIWAASWAARYAWLLPVVVGPTVAISAWTPARVATANTVSSTPAPTPVTVLAATSVARPATSATNATVVVNAPSGTSGRSVSSEAKGGKCNPTTAQIQTRNELALPGHGQDRRTNPGQGEFHPDDAVVSAPGLSVVQGAGRRWAAERLDTTGEGHKRGHDAAYSEHDAKPRGSIRLTPPEPHEPKIPRSARSSPDHAGIAVGWSCHCPQWAPTQAATTPTGCWTGSLALGQTQFRRRYAH